MYIHCTNVNQVHFPLVCCQVCLHVIQSVHTEAERMKEEWEVMVAKGPPPKLSRQQSSIDPPPMEGEGRGSDTYCYELFSMLIGLSQSDIGCAFLSQQDQLVQDLFCLLHVSTCRIQKQVSLVLTAVVPCLTFNYNYVHIIMYIYIRISTYNYTCHCVIINCY